MRDIKDIPIKTLQRLLNLRKLNYIDDQMLEHLKMAWQIAIDPTIIINFAVGYLQLKSQGAPLIDTLHMAIQHRRSVDLRWSDKRWRLEHDRLSRLSTLKQLANDVKTYDITAFQKKLPDFKSGYFIKNSRRLGMEGLRQAHCVASYHPRLLEGSVAIAVVFYQKQRWTVELRLYPDASYPVILQIKSRYNKIANSEETRKIYQQLGLEIQPSETTPAVEDRPWQIDIKKIIPILSQHKTLDQVNVVFSGSGDSGVIDEIIFRDKKGDEITLNERIPIIKIQRLYDKGQFITEEIEAIEPIKDVISDIVYRWLESTNVDWYNNDGGQGEFNLFCKSKHVKGYVDYNILESTTGASISKAITDL